MGQELTLEARQALQEEFFAREIELDVNVSAASEIEDDIQESLVVFTSFESPIEAHIFKNMLLENEVPAVVRDEHLAQVNFLLSNAIGGVRISVPQSYVSQAVELLNQYQTDTYHTSSTSEVEDAAVEKKKSVVFIGFLIIFALVLVLFLVEKVAFRLFS